MIAEVVSSLTAVNQALRRGRAVNVNDQSTKQQAIALARKYFTEVRPSLLQIIGESDPLREHDELWQQLIRLGAVYKVAMRKHLRMAAI
jgi:hypothetical protein